MIRQQPKTSHVTLHGIFLLGILTHTAARCVRKESWRADHLADLRLTMSQLCESTADVVKRTYVGLEHGEAEIRQVVRSP